VGCGVIMTRIAKGYRLKADELHPANFGKLCSKGAALADTLDDDGRLMYPIINGERTTWDTALSKVAQTFQRIIAEHGPDAVAFYVSGQLLTEDYYVANKLMKGFIGSGNIDTNSRLCMSTAVAAHKRAFGADAVPVSYEDMEAADLVVLVGANYAWAHPVLYQRLVAAKKMRPDMRVVVIDPRRTATCDIADLHLAISPGSDGFLFNGLLNYLRREDALNLPYIEAHVEGFSAALQTARLSGSIPEVALNCGVPEAAISDFFRLFLRTERTISIFSQGINQSSSGVDKSNALINLHLATGRIGKPGMGPFSITGQPNAMGGREVGGLANQLAAHMDFTDPEHIDTVSRFWNAPHIAQKPGLKAVEMFQAISDGRIKAIWIMGTNPAVSLPDADRVRQALQACECVVVSDCVRHTDTTACADILLPAMGWGEKEGTVTNSERCISRQRAFIPAAGEAKPDWWMITQVAQRMGWAADFPYTHTAQIFREHASLSGFENKTQRAFDISAFANLGDDDYDALQPIQWPVNAAHPQGTPRLFTDGQFFTPSGKARMLAITPRRPAQATDGEFPFVLNTGRIRDQWHTMTRTGKVPRLNTHYWEAFVEIHAADALTHHLAHGSLAELRSRHGKMLARVHISEDQRPGSVFVPIHWSDVFAQAARVDALVAPITDPISGQPESKHTPVCLTAFHPVWQGFVLSRTPLHFDDTRYCAVACGGAYWRYELAGDHRPPVWSDWAHDILSLPADWSEYQDNASGRYRAACLVNGQLQAVFFLAANHHLPAREWLASLFKSGQLTASERAHLLSARPAKGGADPGRMICACHGVGEKTILNAIHQNELTSVEAIGLRTKAGTGCGSCVAELRRILERA
jgi:assimilatory nitrate reductase catalytic subunit